MAVFMIISKLRWAIQNLLGPRADTGLIHIDIVLLLLPDSLQIVQNSQTYLMCMQTHATHNLISMSKKF